MEVTQNLCFTKLNRLSKDFKLMVLRKGGNKRLWNVQHDFERCCWWHIAERDYDLIRYPRAFGCGTKVLMYVGRISGCDSHWLWRRKRALGKGDGGQPIQIDCAALRRDCFRD